MVGFVCVLVLLGCRCARIVCCVRGVVCLVFLLVFVRFVGVVGCLC